jgi:hypothetical protein
MDNSVGANAATKRGNLSDVPFEGRLLQPPISNSEERWQHAPGDRPELVKQVCGKQTFSDGEFIVHQITLDSKGLHDKLQAVISAFKSVKEARIASNLS